MNNSTIHKKGKLVFTFALIFAFLAVVARTYLLFAKINPETGFYVKNDMISQITVYGTYLLTVITYFSALLFGKNASVSKSESTIGVKTAMIVSAAAMLISGITVYCVGFDGKTNALAVAASFAALISAVYMLTVFVKTSMTAKTLLCVGPLAFCGLSMLCLYFEITQVTNNPAKVIEELSLIASMIFFLQDCKCEIDRAKAGILISSGCAAMIMVSATVVPNVIDFVASGSLVSPFLFSLFGEIGILICIITRTFKNIKSLYNE